MLLSMIPIIGLGDHLILMNLVWKISEYALTFKIEGPAFT